MASEAGVAPEPVLALAVPRLEVAEFLKWALPAAV